MSPGMLAPPPPTPPPLPPKQSSGGSVCALHVAPFFYYFPHLWPSVGARVGPASDGVPVEPTGRVAMADSVTGGPLRPSSAGRRSGPPCSATAFAAGWRTCPSAECCSATGCACAPSAPSLPTGMGFWSERSGPWPHAWEARRTAA